MKIKTLLAIVVGMLMAHTAQAQKSLVAYFSATGTTKKVATMLAKTTQSDLFEIKPEQPYTTADLDWTDKTSRSTLEMKDKSSRPKVSNKVAHIERYDTIYVGFPIWWYIAPTIVNTFLESYDLKGKTIILFATSGGSQWGETEKYLKKSVSASTKIVVGRVLNQGTQQEVDNWVKTLKK